MKDFILELTASKHYGNKDEVICCVSFNKESQDTYDGGLDKLKKSELIALSTCLNSLAYEVDAIYNAKVEK